LEKDGKYYKASNIAESTSTTELRLILEAGILNDEKLALAQGRYTGTGFTAGNEYVGTNGTITSSRPILASETVRIVSTAINATTRYFSPSKTWVNGDGSKSMGVTLRPITDGAIVSGNLGAVKGGDIFDYNNLYKSQSLKKTLIGLEQNFYSDYSNAEAKSTFIAPITLSSDGDYVEFEVILKSLGIGSSTSESMGIMGQATTSNSHLGFNYSGNFLLKAANDIFVSTNAFSTPITANGLPMKVKVAYEGGVINTYKNDVLARANMVASNIILDNIGQSYGVPSFSGILRQVTISHSGGTIVSIATPYLDSTYLTNTKSLEILNTSDGYLTEEQLDYANKTDLKTDLKNRLDTISSFNSIYNGVDSKSDFNTPITLSTDGDYLEFEVLLKELGTSSNTSASMGIVGELGLGTSNIGFINSGNLYIRNSVGVWISTNGFNSPVIIDGSPLKVKMSYEDGSIKTYLNDTYQKTLTASTFIIKNIGSSYNIFPNALFKGGIRNIKISHSSGTIVSISTPYFDETYLVNSKVILNPSTYGYLTPSQVESLKNVTKYPKAFYEFDKIGNAGEHKFKAYISYKEQNGYYIGFDIVRNKDLSDSVYTDNYRISTTTLYFYNGVGMVSQGIELLTSLDNESVYGIVGGSSSTGGVHGNEIFTEAHFFVDGVEITDLTTNIPLTECADFYYTQISNTFTVDDITHSIETIHHKINKFKDNGFSTFNRFIWQKTVNVFWWYHALVCISKGLATQGHNEFLDTATMIGDSLRKLEKIGAREFYSNNQTNGLSAFVTSKMIKPIGDESVVFFVNDRVIDSKYYRKLETPPNPILNDVWESLTEVEFYKK